MNRIAVVITFAGWLAAAVAGCGWLGKTAAKTENFIHTGVGKIGAGIEKMDKDFKAAYHEEKAKQ